MLKVFMYGVIIVLCISCATTEEKDDTNDIRSISGGIVETSDISAEKFQEIPLFISEYKSDLETKGNIDKY